jgi:nucleotide-binding universal stress UspA family protein
MKKQAFLPLVTYPDANADAIAENAAAVVAHLKADLHVTTLVARIPDVKSALSQRLLNLPDLVTEAEALSRTRGEHLLTKVREAAARKEIRLTTSDLSAPAALLGESAAVEARYFDVAVLGWEAENPTSRAIAQDVIFGSGRPVILLPDRAVVDTMDHIAIAWDGSRVAARALADAAVLLERISQISVLTVVDEKTREQPDLAERLVDMLRRRGVAAQGFSIAGEDCPIGTSLQAHAVERGARLLVMGGYGHSRVRDFVLGGATKDILGDLQLPVLLSH